MPSKRGAGVEIESNAPIILPGSCSCKVIHLSRESSCQIVRLRLIKRACMCTVKYYPFVHTTTVLYQPTNGRNQIISCILRTRAPWTDASHARAQALVTQTHATLRFSHLSVLKKFKAQLAPPPFFRTLSLTFWACLPLPALFAVLAASRSRRRCTFASPSCRSWSRVRVPRAPGGQSAGRAL